MLFNSLHYALFFPVVFIVYWLLAKRHYKWQNILLLAASYFFYGCWDWRFVFLLAFSTLLDYYSGLKIEAASGKASRKMWLVISVGINLAFLGVFKYYNFFVTSMVAMLAAVGLKITPSLLHVILPVGISFYTFHGLSYVFDIYNGKIKATRNPVDYSLFVCFFPLLVAGPIERATHLLPQIQQPRHFQYTKAADGLRQILWGLFKKVVIADNCAVFANQIFGHYESYSGLTLVMGAILFAFQIYGDFSGYSDIALGSARLLGFELLQNFNYPYFSRSIAEFWRRWHISLSSWFKDYLYIPLGGNKGSNWLRIRNTLIIFIVSGFWHGANWTFIAWGLLNALFIIPSIIKKTNRNHLGIIAATTWLPSVKDFIAMCVTFSLACFAWIFFRAESITQALGYIKRIFSANFIHKPDAKTYDTYLLVLIVFFMLTEWQGRRYTFALQNIAQVRYKLVRWSIYAFVLFLIGMYMQTSESPFIYFQF